LLEMEVELIQILVGTTPGSATTSSLP